MKVIYAAVLSVSVSGCATILSGTDDEFEFQTDPPGAQLTIVGHGRSAVTSHHGSVAITNVPGSVVFTAKSPARITLSRKCNWIVYAEKGGYYREATTIAYKGNWLFWMNALNAFTLWPIDIATGAVVKPRRTEYFIQMRRSDEP